MTKKAPLLTTCSVTAFSARTQDTSPDTLVVTANRFEQPHSTVPAPTTVVTRQGIDRWQSTSVDDMLRRLPGVDTIQNGGSGQPSSIFIHGTNANHVLVLIDGVCLNLAGVNGSADLSQFPVALVQRVEYIRGPRSAVYGSDTIGGVVGIITTRSEPGTGISAEWGSNSYQNYDASTQRRLGDRTRVVLLDDYAHTRGYDIVAYGNIGAQAQTNNDGFLNKTLCDALEHSFTDTWSGFVRGCGYDNRTNYDTYYSPGSPLFGTRKLYSQGWDTGLHYNGELIKLQLITSYSHNEDYNYNPHYDRYGSSTTLDKMKQYTVRWANDVIVGHGGIGMGADWQKQATTPGTGYVEDGYDQHNTGIHLTGLRQVGDFTFEGAARSSDNSQFGHHGAWQTSADWEFIEGYCFIASYGTSYKAPNLGQLYGFYGDPNLDPEKSKQWEGAFEGLVAGVNWCISGYRNDVSDLIDCDDHTLKHYNEGKTQIKGVETTANFDTGSLTHTVSYGYVDAHSAITDTPLLHRAKQQVKYQLGRQLYDFNQGITYRYLGTRYDKDYLSYPYQTVKIGGASLRDLAVAYPATSHPIVRSKIANLFDEDYETVYGYQTAGRGYTLSGSYIL